MLRKIRGLIRCQKGFTLVELMVVIAIIGILAAIAIPKFTDATQTAQVAKIQGDLSTIDSAIALYYANKASYPADVAALVSDGQLTVEPKDPAGAVYSINTTTHRAEWNGFTSDTDKAKIKGKL